MFEVFSLAAIIASASIIGVIFTQKTLSNFININGNYLISFSAGVFLITSFFMLFEAYEVLGSTIYTVGLAVIGFILAKLVVHLIPEVHHHHDESCSGHKKATHKIIIGDSLHNITDGLVLATSYQVSPELLFPLFLSIIIHEVLQEISEFFVFKEAGYSTKKAILVNMISASSIFIGVAIAFVLPDNHLMQVIILALASGFFLNIVFDDLFPHKHNNNLFIKHLIILIIGAMITLSVVGQFTHSHGSDTRTTHHEHIHDH